MVAPKKFLFDTIFDEETQVREEKKKVPEGPPLVHTEQALIEAVEQMRQTTQESAFAEGRDAGIGAVRDATETNATKALEAISVALSALLELRQSIIREAHKKATALALQIGTKLAKFYAAIPWTNWPRWWLTHWTKLAAAWTSASWCGSIRN